MPTFYKSQVFYIWILTYFKYTYYNIFLLHALGTDAIIETGYDDVEDYDENAVVRRKKQL